MAKIMWSEDHHGLDGGDGGGVPDGGVVPDGGGSGVVPNGGGGGLLLVPLLEENLGGGVEDTCYCTHTRGVSLTGIYASGTPSKE